MKNKINLLLIAGVLSTTVSYAQGVEDYKSTSVNQQGKEYPME